MLPICQLLHLLLQELHLLLIRLHLLVLIHLSRLHLLTHRRPGRLPRFLLQVQELKMFHKRLLPVLPQKEIITFQEIIVNSLNIYYFNLLVSININ